MLLTARGCQADRRSTPRSTRYSLKGTVQRCTRGTQSREFYEYMYKRVRRGKGIVPKGRPLNAGHATPVESRWSNSRVRRAAFAMHI